jgi:hypothetical protein
LRLCPSTPGGRRGVEVLVAESGRKFAEHEVQRLLERLALERAGLHSGGSRGCRGLGELDGLSQFVDLASELGVVLGQGVGQLLVLLGQRACLLRHR